MRPITCTVTDHPGRRSEGQAKAGALTAASPSDWKALRYFNLYRTILSGLFAVLALSGVLADPVIGADPQLFGAVAWLYFAFSVIAQVAVQRHLLPFKLQVLIQVAADIGAIALMMEALGEMSTGFGVLLLMSVAGGSLLVRGRVAILFAAMASLAVLGQQVYASLYNGADTAQYAEAGILGIALFATALVVNMLARRVRVSEALAERREADLADLAKLNEHIIQRMQSGILALDAKGRIKLINESARALLSLTGRATDGDLAAVTPELANCLQYWRHDSSSPSHLLRPGGGDIEVMASFARLGDDGIEGVLVFLEDASAMRQRAQRLKLASLGRLTASIAHEIRNPLGAISHAGQLMAEIREVPDPARRLTGIIQDNCGRINTIVENVLRVSRRKPAVTQVFALKPWLGRFLAGFLDRSRIGQDVLSIAVTPSDLQVRCDPSQLEQVVWNLCENGVRHAQAEPKVELIAGLSSENERPYLEILDNGPGIRKDAAETIFEPFYTTASEGTGLGLYIARELCEANQASLNLVPRRPTGCCFRITFSDPRRSEVPA